jgi:hypothetical protein
VKAKRRSTCPLCAASIEPGEEIAPDREYGWCHAACAGSGRTPDPEASHAMGYANADDAADDHWIYHDN